ncbi:MAG: ribosome biogenesis factor YjgA [Nitrosomonas sp.]|nr:ribosome biogenesis factor YjgA [Nitrosomonas sp.]MDP1950221.1 ribosome biogenesis factor YjgA [Nitrosomonas sp.]
MQNNSEQDIDPDLPPSKTKRKHEMHALQDMGERLVDCDNHQLNELDLPEILRDAILAARQIKKHGARRRQMQYIGKLMRNIDVTAFQEKFASWNNVSEQSKARLHRLEHWRTRLLADETAFTEFGQKYPSADMQHLRLLARNAQKEKAANKPPKSFRLLFQELQSIIPETLE